MQLLCFLHRTALRTAVLGNRLIASCFRKASSRRPHPWLAPHKVLVQLRPTRGGYLDILRDLQDRSPFYDQSCRPGLVAGRRRSPKLTVRLVMNEHRIIRIRAPSHFPACMRVLLPASDVLGSQGMLPVGAPARIPERSSAVSSRTSRACSPISHLSRKYLRTVPRSRPVMTRTCSVVKSANSEANP